MPSNCPAGFSGLCDESCYCYDSEKQTCCWLPYDPVPISQILTVEERLERLEARKPEPVLRSIEILKGMEQITLRMNHFEKKFNEFLDRSKKKRGKY